MVVGELKPHNDTIFLAEYDPAWPSQFTIEKEHIQRALGRKALLIEHVGSTSVPGLVAKPLIDILLVVQDSSDESSYVPELEAARFVLRIREPDWHQHRLFKGPRININMHVFSAGSEEITRMLLLRDWLRTNAEDRKYYADTKRELAGQKWKYVQEYAFAKSQVVASILGRAQAAKQKS